MSASFLGDGGCILSLEVQVLLHNYMIVDGACVVLGIILHSDSLLFEYMNES